MKKSLSLILAALIVSLCFVGCSNKKPDGGTEADSGMVTESPTEKPTEGHTGIIEAPTEDSTQAPTENGGSQGSDKAPEGLKYLRSDSGTQLNMILEYDVAKNSDGSYSVDTTLKLESYSLRVTARDNSNYVKIGDETCYFSTAAISYSGAEKTTFTLATHRFSVSADKTSVPVNAVWYFNGTYNKVPLTAIVIEGEIVLE